ncbi:hypothetical protein D3C85_1774200 [compost metagenome]
MTVAIAADGCLNVLDVFAAGFRQGIGKAMPLQRQPEKMRLLLGRALQTDVFEQAVVVLRDLPQ